MNRKKATALWRKLFGIEIGAMVQFIPDSKKGLDLMWVWDYSGKYDKEYIKIPMSKFVGIIVGKSRWHKGYYLVRWIADRRTFVDDRKCFIWGRKTFTIIEENYDEDK